MNTPLSTLELNLLIFIGADYESAAVLREKLARDFEQDVDIAEVVEALVSLHARNLAAPYARADDGAFTSAPSGAAPDASWWLATVDGQRLAEMEPEGP